jgi:protein-tyrosine phosphatase
MSRSSAIAGLVNCRDLGGLRRMDGSLTPHGVFFRSENVDWIQPSGWDQLRAIGVRTIIDLRQPGERAQDVQSRPAWINTVAVDLDGLENTAFWKDYWDNGLVGTALYFIPHLSAMPERAGSVLSALANAPAGGILFHCMGGRDRTGLIAMLLLAAADVEPDQVVFDYMETVRLGVVRAAAAKRNNAEPMIEQLCATQGTTTEGAFRAAVEQLDLVRFYAAANLDSHDIAAIRTWRGNISR